MMKMINTVSVAYLNNTLHTSDGGAILHNEFFYSCLKYSLLIILSLATTNTKVISSLIMI